MPAIPEAKTVEDLARVLACEAPALASLIGHVHRHYRVRKEPKKTPGEFREIAEPAEPLKDVQRRVVEKILNKVPPSPKVFSYAKGRSSIGHASLHVRKVLVVTLDIEDFFPSIHCTRVEKLFRELLGSQELAWVLTQLTTFRYALPQGAPSSPPISNLIPAGFDDDLEGYCCSRGLTCSRYADDIAISGNRDFGELVPAFCEILRRHGFRPNREKVRLMGSDDVQDVTGIKVNTGLELAPSKMAEYEAEIEGCLRNPPMLLPREDRERLKQSLGGKLNWARQVNRAQWAQLRQRFQKIQW